LAGQAFAHGVAILECTAVGSGGDLADLRGIRFTVFDQSFDAVDVRMDGRDPGTFVFDAELRRGTGFTAPLETVAVGVSTGPLPGTGSTPFPVVHIDFPATIPVAPTFETFTLKFVNVAGPSSVDLFFEVAGIGSFPCPGMDETDENNVAVPTVRSDPTGFKVLAAPPPTPPTASNVLISGTAQVGQVLTGSYTYADAEEDLEGASTFRWLRGSVAIAGAKDKSYTLVAADQGALITFEVTPVAESGPSPGLAVPSNPVGPVTPAPDPPTASSVFISGTAQVGQVLTGSYTYADAEEDLEGASTFRWLRGAVPIAGATAQSYALVAADEGALIRFEVTPVAETGPSPGLAVPSDAVGPITPAPDPQTPPTASSVFISGTPRVGEVLTGSYLYFDVDSDDEGASTFRWLRGTTPIAGATAKSYALVAADEGALIRFEATPVAESGPSPGLAVTSDAVGPVTPEPNPPTPPTASSVSISGTPRVGEVLTGSYIYADAEGDLQGASTFRWLRGAVPIAGATARSYALVAADEGALIRFEVTPVAQSGPSPGLAVTSASVGPVTHDPDPPTPPTASSVFISGAPQVTQVLTGSYTYADTEGDLEGASTFRWLRDRTPIAGATAQTYTLVVADQGAMVSFEVTPVAQSGPSPGLAVVSAAVGPVTPTLGRDRDDGPPECNGSRCLVPLTCNGVGISCTAQVRLFALLPRARLSARPAAQVVRSRIRFAAAAVNVPPGESRTVRLRVTPRGRRIVNSGTRRILRGVLEIRNSPGGVQNIPVPIRIRGKRR